MFLTRRRLFKYAKNKSLAYCISALAVFGIIYMLVSNQRHTGDLQDNIVVQDVPVKVVGEENAEKQKQSRRLADIEFGKGFIVPPNGVDTSEVDISPDGVDNIDVDVSPDSVDNTAIYVPPGSDNVEINAFKKAAIDPQGSQRNNDAEHILAIGDFNKPESVQRAVQRNCTADVDITETEDTYSFVLPPAKIRGIFQADRYAKGASCDSLFHKNMSAIIESNLYMTRYKRKRMDNNAYQTLTSDCRAFREKRGYFETSFTALEKDFPIAYSILAYQVMEQVERLLRAIYRPQNYYCIHMDKKTSEDDLKTIKAIAGCLPNVFFSSESLDVRWGEFAVLGAELVCLRDLWKYTDWRYFINLTGQEFPLKTNLELVKILKAMQGANLVDGTWVRAKHNYFYRWTKSGQPPPHGIRPIKGSVHVAVNRDMVDFALHDKRSHDFLAWLNHTEIPDETFFSSLNHNPQLGIPGSFLGEPEEYPRKPFFMRYKNWEIGHGVWARRCGGKYVHNICILGTGDLHRLYEDISLFANKFYLDYQYLTYECLEELIYTRTKQQYLQKLHIDTRYYELLDQVRLRLVKEKR